MKKTFLTSAVAMAIISPAIADEVYTKDIAGSCNVNILGVADGNAANSFLAQYTPNDYTVTAGQYLAGGTITGTQCPANSYCVGGTFTFSETDNQGIESCPADFGLSVAGTSSADACYHNCTASDIQNGEKVATVKGGTVTAGGVNTCDAECTTGYTFKAASAGSNPLVGKENIATGNELYGHSSLNGDVGSNETGFGLKPGSGEWAIKFEHGTVKGEALCSTQDGAGVWDGASNASEVSTADSLTPETGTGQYCWCKITGYTPSGSSTLQRLSSSWVFYAVDSDFDSERCARRCADNCAFDARGTDSPNFVFRTALFGSVDATSEPAACVANEITITWNPNNGQAVSENKCTYDGDITLPTAPVKTGYTFSGWKLVTK